MDSKAALLLLMNQRPTTLIDAMPADLTTSTARDVAAGRPSELDAITGAVVRAGRALNVPTPTLDRLLEAVEEGRCRASSP